MSNTTFHCLFEQSGTFRDVFKSYGHEAFCYDIQNEYGKTDFQIDLFKEIEAEYDAITMPWRYDNRETIFTKMKPGEDFIMAFFPCTYFTDLNELQFRAFTNQGKRDVITIKEIERVIKRVRDRAYNFEIWNKFCFICNELKISTIIENPFGMYGRNYLKLYSTWRPTYHEKDRSLFGDIRKKPTIYFSINFDMKEKFMMFDKTSGKLKKHLTTSGKERSEITPRYANNFYKRFIEHTLPGYVAPETIVHKEPSLFDLLEDKQNG